MRCGGDGELLLAEDAAFVEGRSAEDFIDLIDVGCDLGENPCNLTLFVEGRSVEDFIDLINAGYDSGENVYKLTLTGKINDDTISSLKKAIGRVSKPVVLDISGTIGLTSLGDNSFYNCRNLKEIVLPDSVRSIGERAFANCRGLTSVNIGSGVTIIGGEFRDCTSLTSITIGSGVTIIYCNVFSNCTGLTSFIVDEANTKYKASDDGKMLLSKDGMNELGLVCYPSATGNVTIPSSVTSIGSMAFMGCKGLRSVTIPDSVTEICDEAFYGCDSLTSVKIPSSVTSIGEWAFQNCRGLRSVNIPSSVTSIGGEAFSNCTGLTSVIVDEANIIYKASDDGKMLLSKDGKTLVCYPSAAGSVTIPSSVRSIGERAFANFTGLRSVNIGSGVTSIGEDAFMACTSLRSVNIGSGVTSIGEDAFYACTSLTSVNIGSGVTSIGDGAFSGCRGLTSFIVDEANAIYKASDDGKMLLSKDGKTLVCYPSATGNVTNIPDSVRSIGEFAFSGCKGLRSVTIPYSVTDIGCNPFNACIGLARIMFDSPADWYYTNSETDWIKKTGGTSYNFALASPASIANIFTRYEPSNVGSPQCLSYWYKK